MTSFNELQTRVDLRVAFLTFFLQNLITYHQSSIAANTTNTLFHIVAQQTTKILYYVSENLDIECCIGQLNIFGAEEHRDKNSPRWEKYVLGNTIFGVSGCPNILPYFCSIKMSLP